MGGNFSLPMVQWVYKRMTIEGFMVGTLAEGKELMALARAGKIKPTPMREEPMADVQKWIDELRAGRVVGRIVLKNYSMIPTRGPRWCKAGTCCRTRSWSTNKRDSGGFCPRWRMSAGS